MFRTDFNHLLQSIENESWYYFMEFISFLGNQYPLMVSGLLIITAIHFRKGILVLNIIAVTSLATVLLKSKIDYPRPLAVDKTLNTFTQKGTDLNLVSLQPSDHFELFGEELLEKARKQDHLMKHGLPSGHTSLQSALWFSLALLFRKRWLKFLAIAMVILTMISRMYLGLHYPGDVLGGLLLGGCCVSLMHWFGQQTSFLKKEIFTSKTLLLFLIPLIFILFEESRASWQLSLILGVNAVIFTLFRSGPLPILSSKLIYRLGFFILLTILFLLLFVLARAASRQAFFLGEFLLMFAAGFLSLFFSIKIALKFNWLLPSQNI